MSEPAHLQLTIDDHGIARIHGGRQLDHDFARTLADIAHTIANTDNIRVALLQPTPNIWAGWPDHDPSTDDLPDDPFAPFAQLPQPTIAALDADTFGGGLELALCADIRIAQPHIHIGFPHILDSPQAFPRAGGLQRLNRALGRSRATQLIMLDRTLDPRRALDWGLINDIAHNPNHAHDCAQRLAQRGPIALRYAKDALTHGADMPLPQALHYETELTILLQATHDRAEGVQAFLHKRPPQFAST